MDTLYEPNVVVRLTGQFRSLGTLTDPDVVTIKVRDPLNSTTTYDYALDELVREGAGIYYLDVTPVTPGRWYYRWECSGGISASVEESFRVRKPVIA